MVKGVDDLIHTFAKLDLIAIDSKRNGYLTIEDLFQHFKGKISEEDVGKLFKMVDLDEDSKISFGDIESFKNKIETKKGDTNKGGDAEHLNYPSLVVAMKLACVREKLKAMMKRDRQNNPPTQEWLWSIMEGEWCCKPKWKRHWDYAINIVPREELDRSYPKWKGGVDIRDKGHEGMSVQDFQNQPLAKQAGLTAGEIVGLRLYTGPGYAPLNKSLRANTDRFPATQYLIDSAIGKLAQHSPPQLLFRGLRKKMPPQWFDSYKIYKGVGSTSDLIIADAAFMSSTTDIEVATGDDFGGPLLFAITAGKPGQDCFLGNGADLGWVSQYPGEAEVLLPSNVILIPKTSDVHLLANSGKKRLEERDIIEFEVRYPWDHVHNCPLMMDDMDYLNPLNGLLMSVWEVEVLNIARTLPDEAFNQTYDNVPRDAPSPFEGSVTRHAPTAQFDMSNIYRNDYYPPPMNPGLRSPPPTIMNTHVAPSPFEGRFNGNDLRHITPVVDEYYPYDDFDDGYPVKLQSTPSPQIWKDPRAAPGLSYHDYPRVSNDYNQEYNQPTNYSPRTVPNSTTPIYKPQPKQQSSPPKSNSPPRPKAPPPLPNSRHQYLGGTNMAHIELPPHLYPPKPKLFTMNDLKDAKLVQRPVTDDGLDNNDYDDDSNPFPIVPAAVTVGLTALAASAAKAGVAIAATATTAATTTTTALTTAIVTTVVVATVFAVSIGVGVGVGVGVGLHKDGSFTSPYPPTNVTALYLSSRTAYISWIAGDPKSCNFKEWTVSAVTNPPSSNPFQGCKTLTTRNITACLVTETIVGTTYEFSVSEQCTNGGGSSASSPSAPMLAFTYPSSPSSVQASLISNTSAAILWRPGNTNECQFSSWTIIPPSVSYACNLQSYNTTSCVANGLIPGSTYAFGVQQNCLNGPSGSAGYASNVVSAPLGDVYIPPGTPIVNAALISGSSYFAAISWTPGAINSCKFSTWSVGPSNMQYSCNLAQYNTTECVAGPLTQGAVYQFTVLLMCTNGAGSGLGISNTITVPLSYIAPTAPINLNSQVFNNTANLSWTPGVQNNCSFLSWSISPPFCTPIFNYNTLSCVTQVLSTGTYTWTIQQLCNNGNGSPVSSSSSFDIASPYVAPTAPINLQTQLNPNVNTVANLSWSPGVQNNCSFSSWLITPPLCSPVTNYNTLSCLAQGLTPGSTYTWTVQESCSNGNGSPVSSSASFTVPAADTSTCSCTVDKYSGSICTEPQSLVAHDQITLQVGKCSNWITPPIIQSSQTVRGINISSCSGSSTILSYSSTDCSGSTFPTAANVSDGTQCSLSSFDSSFFTMLCSPTIPTSSCTCTINYWTNTNCGTPMKIATRFPISPNKCTGTSSSSYFTLSSCGPTATYSQYQDSSCSSLFGSASVTTDGTCSTSLPISVNCTTP